MSATSCDAPVRSGPGGQVDEQALRATDVARNDDVHHPQRDGQPAVGVTMPRKLFPAPGRVTRRPVCGITGLVSAGGPPDEGAVRRMNAALRHRGPDAEGVWRNGRAVLGHRRLSIIDLSPEGTQPLLNEDGVDRHRRERRDLQLRRATRGLDPARPHLSIEQRQRGRRSPLRRIRRRLRREARRDVRVRALGRGRTSASFWRVTARARSRSSTVAPRTAASRSRPSSMRSFAPYPVRSPSPTTERSTST